MSAVKRYEFELDCGSYYNDHEMNEREDGEYVKYEDYPKLAADRAALAEALREIHKLADGFPDAPLTIRTRIRTLAREALSRAGGEP